MQAALLGVHMQVLGKDIALYIPTLLTPILPFLF